MSEAVARDDGRARIEALLDVQRFDEASRLASEMVAQQPDDATAHALQARSLIGAKDYEAGLAAADRAVALAPQREWCHRLRAVALRKLGRHDEAIAAATESVRLEPELAAAHQTLSHSYRLAREGPAAWQAAMQAVTLDPRDPDSHEAAGLAALELEWLQQAEHGFRTQLEIDPHSTYALNNLGVTLERAGRKAEAMDLYTRAAQQEPREPLFRRNVGRLAYAQSPYRMIVLVLMIIGFIVAGILGFVVAVVALASMYGVQMLRVRRIGKDPARAGQLGVETAKLEAMRLHLGGESTNPRQRWLTRIVIAAIGVSIVVGLLLDPSLRSPLDDSTNALRLVLAALTGFLVARLTGRFRSRR